MDSNHLVHLPCVLSGMFCQTMLLFIQLSQLYVSFVLTVNIAKNVLIYTHTQGSLSLTYGIMSKVA